MPLFPSIKDIKIIDWFLKKVSRQQIIIVLLVLVSISITLNVEFFNRRSAEVLDNRNYRDSIANVYREQYKKDVATFKTDFKELLGLYKESAKESQQLAREIEKINFDYQKELIDRSKNNKK